MKKDLSDPDKISFVPVIEYFKSIGVTHQGYFILAERVKRFNEEMYTTQTSPLVAQSIIILEKHTQVISGMIWNVTMDGGELTFVVQYLNCEDIIK